MNTKISKLTSTDIDDFSRLVQIFDQVFEWQLSSIPDSSHLQKVISNSRFIAFVAKANNEVIGGLTAHVLDRYDAEKPSAYLYDLAVLSAQRRKGIGKQLVAALNEHCRKNGFSEVFVQAEAEDLQAVDFYKTTPITDEMKAIQFTYSLEENHEGKIWAIHALAIKYQG